MVRNSKGEPLKCLSSEGQLKGTVKEIPFPSFFPSLIFSLYLIMPTLKLSHDEVRLLNDMFSCISDLGLFEGYEENEQDSSPDVFDKLWDKVVKL